MLSVLPRLPVAHIRARSLAKARTAPPLQTQPAWLATLGLSVNEWGEISGTNLSAATPTVTVSGSPTAKIDAYCSLVKAGTRILSVANGGHADYAGNEVNEIDLADNAPGFVELLAGTASVTQDVAYYGDGRPSSRHTYYSVTHNAVDDRIMLSGGYVYGTTGAGTATLASYNLTGNSYNASGTHPDCPVTGYQAACWTNPATGDIYRCFNFALAKWTRSTNTWATLIGSGDCYGSEAASAYDTTRGRALILDWEQSTAFTHDADATSYTERTLTGTEAANVIGVAKLGMCYCEDLDAFLVRAAGSGGTVYKIDASTFAVTALSTTGGASVPATANGPFNKFFYFPDYGVCAYVPTYTGNVWVLRVA